MYCPKCKIELSGDNSSAYHIHDIIYHQEYFENQINELSKDHIVDILVSVTKSLYFQEQ